MNDFQTKDPGNQRIGSRALKCMSGHPNRVSIGEVSVAQRSPCFGKIRDFNCIYQALSQLVFKPYKTMQHHAKSSGPFCVFFFAIQKWSYGLYIVFPIDLYTFQCTKIRILKNVAPKFIFSAFWNTPGVYKQSQNAHCSL